MLVFTEEETRIFESIVEYCSTLKPMTTPRLAGGFVRDRIMGIHSSDIDIALDNISGYEFAVGFMKSSSIPGGNVHRILANPDKSKHLETAVVNILGISIDFVHLRNEEYSSTRIPTIKPGTAQEDALRRDITINSLFYNLITKQVEDFSCRGIDDIHKRVINTPLDPKITLFDDPLRILRIFRFKSKFNFNIDQRVYDAIEDHKIREALRNKVSNERICAELLKAMEYENGHLCFLEIAKTKYISEVLKPVGNEEIEYDGREERYFHAYSALISDLCSGQDEIFKEQASISKFLEKYSINTRVIYWYILLQWFIGKKVQDGKRKEYLNVVIIRDSLKGSKCHCSEIKRLEESYEWLLSNNESSLAEIMITCREIWLEALIITFIISKNTHYIGIINSIIQNEMYDCYKMQFKINGDILVKMGCPTLKINEALKRAKIYEIEHPGCSLDEITCSLKLNTPKN